MHPYKSEPLSRKSISSMTMYLRRFLKLENRLYFPIMGLLESLQEISKPFYLSVVPDKDLPKNLEAYTDVLKHVITIKQSVYDGACNGNGRARFTIAHEIGHYMLAQVFGVRFQRNLPKSPMRRCENPEWQADAFAGELLVPADLLRGMSADEIRRECGVSSEAARVQLKLMEGRR